MEAILVKVFATALALSQVVARPDAVKTQFDPEQDKGEVVRILSDGCTYMKKAFDIENLDLDDLISTAMTDTKAGDDEIKAFKGVKFSDLFTAYKEICKKETVEKSVIDAAEVIDFYNLAIANLPDHTRLKGLKLPGMSNVFDAGGKRFAELFEPNHRRISIPISQVPEHVKAAFIAAEDKRFMTHKGVDERSVIRAFMTSVADTGKRQGGSTITQQVVKNLLVGDDISYERKMREIVIASRVEHTLSKDEILELYVNKIFLGHRAYGIAAAADLTPVAEPQLTASQREHWSLRPRRSVAAPPVQSIELRNWSRTAVDRFIAHKLEEVPLTPARAASKRVCRQV